MYRTKEQIDKDVEDFAIKKKFLGYDNTDVCQYSYEFENFCLLKGDCICSRVNMNLKKIKT